jgi:Immunity protein Imm1
VIVTASLTTGIARVTHGITASKQLVDEVLRTDHVDWETTLYVGDVEFHCTDNGPFPNHQLRLSVRPAAGCAALNYMDNDDPHMSIANSYNPQRPLPEIHLIFNGSTGSIFPRTATIPVVAAREALHEWLETRKRPECIEWRPFDAY